MRSLPTRCSPRSTPSSPPTRSLGAGGHSRLAWATGIGTIVFSCCLQAALLVAVAQPALRLLRLGALDTAGAALVGRVLAAYAIGLIGYASFQLLTRAAYATADCPRPACGVAAVAHRHHGGWSAAASGGTGRRAWHRPFGGDGAGGRWIVRAHPPAGRRTCAVTPIAGCRCRRVSPGVARWSTDARRRLGWRCAAVVAAGVAGRRRTTPPSGSGGRPS